MTDTEKLLFIEEAIKTLFSKNIDGIKPEDNLGDLGLDSLDIVELTMYYEDTTNTVIESDATAATVADLMVLMA
jgi:acyl carrier protein